MATMNAKRPWWRKRTILVLRPAAALRRVDRLSSADRSREAIRLLSRLARFHVPAAQLHLAHAYLEGVAVPGSRQDAIIWCEMAARAGLVDAQCLLPALHLSGPANPHTYELFSGRISHVTSDPYLGRALHWATKAAAGGSADAKAILAHIHAYGPDGFHDPERSATLYHESAEEGSAKGAFGYGMLLMRQPAQAAIGGQAVHWIRKAADAEIPSANYIYGYMCEHGIGLSKRPAEAALFYERSARRGIVQGQLRWGMLLIEESMSAVMPWKGSHGSARQHSLVSRRPPTRWVTFMPANSTCRRTSSKPRSGIDTLPNEHMGQRLSSSHNFLLTTGLVYHRILTKPFTGTARQPRPATSRQKRN